MKTLLWKRVRITAVAAVVVAFSLAVGLRALRAANPPLVVVVAAASPMQDISRANLRRAFLGEPTGGPGGKLVPLNQLPGTPARSEFDRVVLGLQPDDVARFWIDQRIRGLGSAPRAFPAALIARVVPQLPGAIGYLRTSEVVPGIKAITIDGKNPGKAGYLLQ